MNLTYTPESQTSPDDFALLFDQEPMTCVNYLGGSSLPAHAEINYVFNDLNNTIYIYGTDLGCTDGSNARMYVIPVAKNNTANRLGKVRVCALEKSIIEATKEACIFVCNHTQGDLEAFRIIRRSLVNPPTAWSLCELSGKIYHAHIYTYLH